MIRKLLPSAFALATAVMLLGGCNNSAAVEERDGVDSIPKSSDSIPKDSIPKDSIPKDSIPKDSIPKVKVAYRLQLLHFADVDGNEETALATVDEFSALVDGFKKDTLYGRSTLFVSSGDHIIQGPRFYAAEQIKAVTQSDEPGSADIALMNAMGVQAAAIGNHELDAGPGELKEAINKDINALFPHLAANINFSGESFTVGTDGNEASKMAGEVAKYAVVTVNREKIGVVGAAAPTLPTITTVGNLIITPNSNSIDLLAAEIQPSIDALVAAGVNKIVLLSHMQQIAIEKALAAKLSGVDIIVAGGSNTRMGDGNDQLFTGDPAFDESYPYQTKNKDGNPILVVNVDGDYKYLGRLVVGFDKDGIVVTESLDSTINGAYAATGSTVAAVGDSVNSKVVTIRDAIQKVIEDQYNNIIGYTNVYLDGRRSKVRTEETNLGNLTADANLWYANLLSNIGRVHVSLKNGGGIRTEIGSVSVPAGSTNESDITFHAPAGGGISEGHLKATLRFDNGLVLLQVTPAELKDLLEHTVAATADGATPGQFPQIGGMRIVYNPSFAARTAVGNGERIRELEILNSDGSIFEDVVTAGAINSSLSDSYRLVTLNFLANGGDDYPFDALSNADRYNLYEGPGYGEDVDYPDANLSADPGKNSSFSSTGGEQDALAEYMQAHHSSVGVAYNLAETALALDSRIKKQ